jgi:hypothetical protein
MIVWVGRVLVWGGPEIRAHKKEALVCLEDMQFTRKKEEGGGGGGGGIAAVVVDMGWRRREAMEKTRLRTILSLFVFWLPQ